MLAPTSTAAADAYRDARAASDAMGAAIKEARGAGGLNGHEPKALEERLKRFDRALDKLDPNAARDEPGALAAEVAKLIGQGAIDAQAGAAQALAADRPVAAANALPD